MAVAAQFPLDVVDREVALAHGHHQLAHPIPSRRRLRPPTEVAEEALLAIAVTAELMAQDPEAAGGIAEPLGDLFRRQLVREVGSQGFILALQGLDGLEKEEGFLRELS